MEHYGDGWFKVSRRMFDSSRWFGESPATLKLLLFVIGYAQDPTNPEPGLVPIGDVGLSHRTGLTLEEVGLAIERLSSEDPESRSGPHTRGDRRTLERVPGGVRLLNFELFQPGVVESAAAKRAWRRERARKAAVARWHGGVDGEGSEA